MWEPAIAFFILLSCFILFMLAPFAVLWFFGLVSAIIFILVLNVMAFALMFLSSTRFWPARGPSF